MSRLSDLEPAEPIVRYGHEASGDLLHIDARKLGRIVQPSQRVVSYWRDVVEGVGCETLLVAIDDHTRLEFTAMQLDEKRAQAVLFLRNTVEIGGVIATRTTPLLADDPGAEMDLPGTPSLSICSA